MSQSRSRKAQSFGGENSGKARSSVVKDSGDAAHSVHHQNQPKTKQNSRTKNKIPKSLRYDLDNALVSLCDVWFDDIKPHLLRNKIKLHVDNNGSKTTASGDCRRMQKDAPGCSHHDPGDSTFLNSVYPAASTANACELCCLLSAAANSIESAICQSVNVSPTVAHSISSGPDHSASTANACELCCLLSTAANSIESAICQSVNVSPTVAHSLSSGPDHSASTANACELCCLLSTAANSIESAICQSVNVSPTVAHSLSSGPDHSVFVPQRRQRTPANSAASSPPPPIASKVRFVSRSTSRPQSPIHCRLGPTTQNNNRNIKSLKGLGEEVQPQSPLPPVAGRPRLCRSCQPSDLSPKTNKRRKHTTPSFYTRDNILPFPRKLLKKHKKSQTNITWVHYKSTYYMAVDPASYTVFPINTNVSVSKNRDARVQQRQRTKMKSPSPEITNPVKQLTTEDSHKKKLPSSTVKSTKYRPTSPAVLIKLTEELSVDTNKISQSRDQNRSREKKPNTNSVMCKKRTGERKVDPSIASQYYDNDDKSNSQFCRCFATSATTKLNQAKNKECVKNQKISDTDCNFIFDQDLIDIIGTENDKRLRILYNSPMTDESNSVLNLLPSPAQQIPEERSKRKNVPWR